MSGLEISGLILAAVAGGANHAVAGGGTLVTFPTLLFHGTSATIANATLALVIGISGSLYGYRRHIENVQPWPWHFIPLSIIGGFAGSLLLTRTTDKTVSKLVPFLILFATLLSLAQGALRKVAAANADLSRPKLLPPTALPFGAQFGSSLPWPCTAAISARASAS